MSFIHTYLLSTNSTANCSRMQDPVQMVRAVPTFAEPSEGEALPPSFSAFVLRAPAHGLTARASTGGYFPPRRGISLDSSECCWRHWAWSYFWKPEAFPYTFNSSLSSRGLVAKAPFQVFQNWTGTWQSQAGERMRTESISAASHVENVMAGIVTLARWRVFKTLLKPHSQVCSLDFPPFFCLPSFFYSPCPLPRQGPPL